MEELPPLKLYVFTLILARYESILLSKIDIQVMGKPPFLQSTLKFTSCLKSPVGNSGELTQGITLYLEIIFVPIF